jgi:hypothetical protein
MISVFFGYITYIIKNWGVQPSISASAYVTPKGTYWFTLATFGYAFSAGILGILLLNSVLTLLTGTLLGFVAVAYDFRNGELNYKVHMISAGLAVILSQLALIFEYKMWWLSLISLSIAGSLFLFPKLQNKVWWQEIIIIVGLFTALGIKLVETL